MTLKSMSPRNNMAKMQEQKILESIQTLKSENNRLAQELTEVMHAYVVLTLKFKKLCDKFEFKDLDSLVLEESEINKLYFEVVGLSSKVEKKEE